MISPKMIKYGVGERQPKVRNNLYLPSTLKHLKHSRHTLPFEPSAGATPTASETVKATVVGAAHALQR